MTKNFTKQNRIVLLVMMAVFAVYNGIIYTQDCASSNPLLSPYAMDGQKVWQKNNCSSCHQIYGLGGYLGPDLTNVISAEGKGEAYVKAFVKAAYKSMPDFDFKEGEVDALVHFLKEVDETGVSPVTNGKIKNNGWIELDYK